MCIRASCILSRLPAWRRIVCSFAFFACFWLGILYFVIIRPNNDRVTQTHLVDHCLVFQVFFCSFVRTSRPSHSLVITSSFPTVMILKNEMRSI
ncbi:hypothetical protein N656DRAFT_743890 [Canariomyces notabilis]|uniref:Uncharacterized protein n=1 Tax=Canariomyces notabilis TaxID=2074819 RepID=A0AAN6YXU0_9PEZI|nr:hypothetical protein N656DRAFT_743890 [Canariomyces arenarius]